jgi:hypothetical protein
VEIFSILQKVLNTTLITTALVAATISPIAYNLVSNLLWENIRNIFLVHPAGIRGFWLGRVIYTAKPERVAYNLYKITGRDSGLRVYGEHYDTNSHLINRYKGTGIFKNGILSFVLTSIERNRQRSSVNILKIEHRHTQERTSLVGLFADMEEERGDFLRLFHGMALVEPYRITSVRISRGRQMSRLWRRTYYKSVTEVGRLLAGESDVWSAPKRAPRQEGSS